MFTEKRLKIFNELLELNDFISVQDLVKRYDPKEKASKIRRGIERDHLQQLSPEIIEYGSVPKKRKNKPSTTIDAVRIAHTIDALKYLYKEHHDVLKLHNSPYVQNMVDQDLVYIIKTSWGIKTDADYKETYFFNWEEVPGKDNKKLINYLIDEMGEVWGENPEIKKSDDDKSITVSIKNNSYSIIEGIENGKTRKVDIENNYLKIRLNDEKTHAVLLTEDGSMPYSFHAKLIAGKLNIYKPGGFKALLNLEDLPYYISDKDLEWILRLSPTTMESVLLTPITNGSRKLFSACMLTGFASDIRENNYNNSPVDLLYRVRVRADIIGKHKIDKSAGDDVIKFIKASTIGA